MKRTVTKQEAAAYLQKGGKIYFNSGRWNELHYGRYIYLKNGMIVGESGVSYWDYNIQQFLNTVSSSGWLIYEPDTCDRFIEDRWRV